MQSPTLFWLNSLVWGLGSLAVIVVIGFLAGHALLEWRATRRASREGTGEGTGAGTALAELRREVYLLAHRLAALEGRAAHAPSPELRPPGPALEAIRPIAAQHATPV